MKPPVIVTRAEPGARETAARLEALGYAVIRSPMLELKPLEGAVPDLSGICHLVFTSANGVRFFLQAMGGMTGEAAGLTAWSVGPATAAAVRAAGFGLHVEGDGNADDLAARIRSADVSGGFLHVANAAAAGNLVKQLEDGGRTARFQALYETVPAGSLAPAAGQALSEDAACAVLIHSAKGASAFAAAAGELSLASSLVVAISEAAAAPLEDAGVRQLVTAGRPNEEALLEALEEACRGL